MPEKTDNSRYIRIWQTVQLIPTGTVATYGQIADLAGLPGRARLVGKALAKVPDLGWKNQAVPWYRVVNSQGKISFPIDSESFVRQKGLLQEENIIVQGAKIKLFEFQWQPDLTELLFKLTY
ncbi:MGMT family protein [Thalassotalea sp. SU-HH00458]|uniref:MGMT family protein n=1 Tax=Thalassotalea sp. SU-HH00458 TaxID=3127657 RepID=UPI003108162E